ncbi:MAG: hypothetical protein ACP5XB_01010 [Isosphaeraceae bacterium]
MTAHVPLPQTGAERMPPVGSRGRRLPFALLILGLLLFIALGLARLGWSCLLEPDSPDYVLMARTLVARGEYRAPYDPAGVPHVWRPPGLSMLLAPAALIWPYNVVAAKSVVLAWGVALLGAFYLVSRKCGPNSYVLLACALVASSPYTLLWSTEVLSEVPFVALTLAVIALVGHSGASTGRWIAAALLLAFIPLVRTIGLTIWLGCVAWAIFQRGRQAYLRVSALAASLVPFGVWTLRNAGSGEESYLPFLWHSLRYTDLGVTLHQGAGAGLLNYKILVGLLLPGAAPSRPAYDMTTVCPSCLPVQIWPFAAVLASALLAAAGLGLWRRRREGGALAASVLLFYMLPLVPWFCHSERLLWPAVPIVLAFLPARLDRAVSHLKQRSFATGRQAHAAALTLGALVVCWQLAVSAGMAWTNLEHLRAPDAPVPCGIPGYFADWRAAGKWLRVHSQPNDRAITARIDLAYSAQRFMRWMVVGPAEMPAKVRSFAARYVVLHDDFDRALLPQWMLVGHPAYSPRLVYARRGIAIFEILPNRTGIVTPLAQSLEGEITACEAALLRAPWRVDLRFGHAALLEQAGNLPEAMEDLRILRRCGRADILTLDKLAYLSLQTDHPADSLRFVNEASIQPESENFADELRWAQSRARSRLSGQTTPADRVRDARRLASDGRFDEAKTILDALVEGNLRDELARFARGELHQRLGQIDMARADFQRAAELSHPEAQAKLRILAYGRALERPDAVAQAGHAGDCDADPLDPRSYVEYAEMLRRDETPGKALDVLEKAVARFGDKPSLLIPLGGLYLDYGMVEDADSVYRRVLRVDPRNIDASIGLERVSSLMAPPDFP